MSKTIVMIHGMWGSAWYWENFKGFFEQRGYRCHTPTLRYHDMNPADTPDPALGSVSLTDYAQDLEGYIAGLNEKPCIIGHSMGGLLAQILGARGLAESLVLLTPASPSGINALKFTVIKSFSSVLLRWGFWHRPNRLPFKAAVYSMMHLLPETEQQAVYNRLVYESGRAAAEIGFWLLDPKKAAGVDESRLTCPTLVIAGAEDRITPVSVVKKVADKYRAVASLKVFENHAHWVVGEPGWEDVAAYVHDWLEQKEP